MTMFPICSATTSCSSHSQIALQGGLQPLSYQRVLGVRSILDERVAVSSCSVNHLQGASFRTEATASLYSNFSDGRDQTPTLGFGNGNNNFLNFVSSGKQQLTDLEDRITEDASILDSMDPQTVRIGDVIQDETASAADLLSINEDLRPKAKVGIGDVFSGVNESLNDSVITVKSFVTSSLDDANKSVNSTISQVISSVDRIRELAYSQLAGLSSDLSEASNATGKASVDLLRRAIVQIEGSLNQGATFAVYAYGSAKELLPSGVQNAVNLSEEWVGKLSRPVGTILEQANHKQTWVLIRLKA